MYVKAPSRSADSRLWVIGHTVPISIISSAELGVLVPEARNALLHCQPILATEAATAMLAADTMLLLGQADSPAGADYFCCVSGVRSVVGWVGNSPTDTPPASKP